jgi:phosphatidylserine/phosphatidylglycerophosphate/cardiolipin synthase-like enzyme
MDQPGLRCRGGRSPQLGRRAPAPLLRRFLPPAGDICGLHPGHATYIESSPTDTDEQITLRNDAFRKAVNHAKEFIYGTRP